ncbi:early endosome antigen 1 [Ricinus communis]|uniref:early endosome antigen 1 n=1 Tax=Ricinus communis TaxID=3988 RepID=UPI00201A482A|nr:early endosome antigen 1 [Ricinus communis]
MEVDDLDSLFEGMVLFTPSQLDDDELQKQQQQQDDVRASAASTSDSFNESEAETPPACINENTLITSENKPQQEPLDENLFSDLTLQTLSSQSHPIPDTTSPTTSRHVTRKKKRAASLRIGYARDSSSLDDPPYYPSPANDDHDHDHPSNLNHSPAPIPTPTSLADAQSESELELDISTSTPSVSVSDSQFDAQFDRIQSQISIKLQHSRQSAASVSAARKDAITRRRKAAQDLNSASANHRDLELQLEAACESEDFDAAQRISDCLAGSDKERLLLLTALKHAEAYCDTLDSKMHDVLNSQIVAEQECAALLSKFAKDAEFHANLVWEKARSLSSKEMDQWFSLTEALEAKKIELDIESHFINDARLAVSYSIEHSVEDYRKEQEILYKKKDLLTKELQKLLALVKLKEMEIAENDTNIKAVEEKISDVISGFHESQSSIDSKYDRLQSELSQMHLQTEALSTKRKEIDKFLAQEEGHEAKLRELATLSEYEAKSYQEVVELRKSLMLSILKSTEDKVRLAKTEEKLIEDVQMLQHQVSSARASLQELSSTKSNIQQTISSFKQRIFFIDKRVPELEAEKKVAAAARNFKEAARIAAEAKSLSVEKDGVQIDLEKATLELEKLEKDIKSTVSRLQDTEQLISSKEKEVAMARFQSLLLIAGAATAERFAALELGDTEEANLLLAEAEAANAEAKKLQPIYNFNEEEFSNLPKHFISMELVSKLGRKQLIELAASVDVSAKQ